MAKARQSLVAIVQPIVKPLSRSTSLERAGSRRGLGRLETDEAAPAVIVTPPQGAERARRLFVSADTAMRDWLSAPSRLDEPLHWRERPLVRLVAMVGAAMMAVVGSLLAFIAIAAG